MTVPVLEILPGKGWVAYLFSGCILTDGVLGGDTDHGGASAFAELVAYFKDVPTKANSYLHVGHHRFLFRSLGVLSKI